MPTDFWRARFLRHVRGSRILLSYCQFCAGLPDPPAKISGHHPLNVRCPFFWLPRHPMIVSQFFRHVSYRLRAPVGAPGFKRPELVAEPHASPCQRMAVNRLLRVTGRQAATVAATIALLPLDPQLRTNTDRPSILTRSATSGREHVQKDCRQNCPLNRCVCHRRHPVRAPGG